MHKRKKQSSNKPKDKGWIRKLHINRQRILERSVSATSTIPYK